MANTFNFGNGKWATKKDRILGFNNQNANFKPLAFSNTRASIATVVNKTGLVETVVNGMPRVDYLSNTQGAYLVEPQSTNLILQSQVFSGYSGNNEVVADDVTTSPDGTLNGGSVTDNNDGSTGTSQVFESVTVDISSTYTFSFFAKKKGNDFISIRTGAFTTPNDVNSYFDLNLGTVVSQGTGITASIEDYGNGWYRCINTFTTDPTDTEGNLTMRLSDNGTDTNITRDGTNSIYTWGWQFEKLAYATSYISTSGSAQTRLAETANQTFQSGIINSDEGVLYVEMAALANDYSLNGADYSSQINLSDGNLNNGVNLRFRGTLLQALYFDGSSYSAAITYNNINTEFIKVAFQYKLNEFKLFVNGVQVGVTDTSGSIGAFTLNRLTFDNTGGLNPFFGKIKDMKIYTTILTDSQLATLTK